MAEQNQWSGYYDATRAKPPRPLLVKALGYVAEKGKALDLGAGALNDTRYLLDQGFEVVAVDKSPQVQDEAKSISSDKLHVQISSFEDFIFPENTFDLVSAMFALPFTLPENFNKVFFSLIQSLKKGGVFCGQFFGTRDGWASEPKMTFHSEEQVKTLLNGLEILYFNEEEKDGKTARGDAKHWHVFHVIARK